MGKEKITFYTGFDPTADSLHVGHFMQLIIMRYMQQAGHRPIVLLGGGTKMVGDPTGKTDMRKMLTQEQICLLYTSQNGLAQSRERAKALIMAGIVYVLSLIHIFYDALVKRFKLDNPQKKVRAKKSDAEDEDEE